jgi:hypothetical protein
MPTSKSTPPPSEVKEILTAEFEYIAGTANQANEDRARVSSFYLVAVGSLVAALFGTQVFDPDSLSNSLGVNLMFSILFLLLTFLGGSTILQLARLRSAWHDSIMAMNRIKDFVIRQNPSFSDAFPWRTITVPPKYKRDSVSYYQAVEVAVIGGLMFGAGVFFAQQAFLKITTLSWVISVIMGCFMILLQLQIYKRAVNKQEHAPRL